MLETGEKLYLAKIIMSGNEDEVVNNTIPDFTEYTACWEKHTNYTNDYLNSNNRGITK